MGLHIEKKHKTVCVFSCWDILDYELRMLVSSNVGNNEQEGSDFNPSQICVFVPGYLWLVKGINSGL